MIQFGLVFVMMIFVVTFIIIRILYGITKEYICVLNGYMKCEYRKIPSHGDIITKYKWVKSETEGLSYHKDSDFVSIIKPYNKRLRPK